jgi:hypothetical protein
MPNLVGDYGLIGGEFPIVFEESVADLSLWRAKYSAAVVENPPALTRIRRDSGN